MTQGKSIFSSKTIGFFSLVFVGGGADIVTSLVEQEVIDWRSIALAVIALVGIALRYVTTQPIE